MKIKEITAALEEFAPLSYQEEYDNAGLILGNPEKEIYSALICIDITEAVLTEAVKKGVQLIISHHPIIFSGMKKLTGKDFTERIIVKAIKNDIALYACHTNIDSVYYGVNHKICQRLGLHRLRILKPAQGQLLKLVTFIPVDHAEKVREAVFSAGAGHIGEYDSCSYNAEGFGTFRGSEDSNPFVGKKGILHYEKEIRFETIFPKAITNKVVQSLLNAHPYEEVAYDIYPLENTFDKVGMGMIGELDQPAKTIEFLEVLKKVFYAGVIRHTKLIKDTVSKVAVCGGSGSFLLPQAIKSGADIFVSGDFKYHQFFDADGKIVIADIGHFESEQFTKEIFYEILIKKFPKFAVHLTEVNTNPINYF